jgi:hypothetical protein
MMFFGSVGIMVVIAMVTPFFLCAFIPLGFVYHYMQQVGRPPLPRHWLPHCFVWRSRELNALASVS